MQRPVALINAGGSSVVDNWGADNLKILSAFPNSTPSPITQSIDISGVAHPAPQAVYQNYAEAPSSSSMVTGSMSYQLSVPDGTYTVRLHFVEPNANAAFITNFRKFDVEFQGSTVLAGYDVVADAGAAFKATEKNFVVTAVGGTGISLNLVSIAGIYSTGAIISGIEVLANNPAGVAAPTFNLELSGDGGANWMPIASGLGVDQYGRGSYPWSIPGLPEGSQYLVRVIANDGLRPQGVSDQPFQITDAGHSYYVNDNSMIGDEFATAVGDNANSGKSPSAPMASLQALLNAYSLGSGDVVYVDAGTYNLIQNVVIGPQHAGVRIQGPSTGVALLNRGNTNYDAYAIDVQHAANVTLDHLSITGGYVGINLADNSQSSGLTVSNSTVFANVNRGISIGSTNDSATITGSTFYGIPGGSPSDDQSNSIYGLGANDLIVSGNQLFDAQNENVRIQGQRITVNANEAYGGSTGIYLIGSGTVTGNQVHDNRSLGILASPSGAGNILVTGNTVYAHPNPQQTGIYATGAEIRGNVVYDNYDGILGDRVIGNRVYHNTNIGINGSGLVQDNVVFGNGVGIRIASGSSTSGRASNNLIYDNATTGIVVAPSNKYEFLNNTVYQPTGDAIRFEGDAGIGSVGLTNDATLRNNVLWVGSGYGLVVPASAEGGLVSDYNVFFATGTGKLGNWQGRDFTDPVDWFFETGQDLHSQVADPQFVSPAGPDGILGYGAADNSDHGLDDDFRVLVGSPVIDRGSPIDPYFAERSPNGNRIDVGMYGNRPDATPSVAQTVRLLGPDPLQKVQVGQQLPIRWQSSGLTTKRPVALINTGGGTVDSWNADPFFAPSTPITLPVDTSGVADPAPQSAYQTNTSAGFTPGSSLNYQLVVPDGSYSIRLHFAEPVSGAYSGMRQFDIQLQGNTVQSAYDIFTAAGGALKATTQTFDLTASGGSGISLQLVSLTSNPAIVSAIEVLANDPYGLDSPTFDLELSGDNGVSWSPLAANQPADRFGSGNYLWTVPSDQPLGGQYLVRVTSDDGIHPQDGSTRTFVIASDGHDYYVNDGSQSGDIFTTAIGNNLNSGKSPDQPMANLAALLASYQLGPLDVMHVDTGTYDLLRNIVVSAKHSGVTIEGPSTADAVLRRGVTGGFAPRIGSVFEMQQAVDVTIDHLNITNAFAGVYAADDAGVIRLSVTNSSIYGTKDYGIYLGRNDDFAAISGNTLYGLPGGIVTDNQLYGIYLLGNDAQVVNNTIYDSSVGVADNGVRVLIDGNDVYGNQYGIQLANVVGDLSLVTGNLVHDNDFRGISAAAGRVIGNTVYGQSSATAIGIEASQEVGGNIVYDNYDGISGDRRFEDPRQPSVQ